MRLARLASPATLWIRAKSRPGRSCSRANVAFVAGDLNNVRVNKVTRLAERNSRERYLAYFENYVRSKCLGWSKIPIARQQSRILSLINVQLVSSPFEKRMEDINTRVISIIKSYRRIVMFDKTREM